MIECPACKYTPSVDDVRKECARVMGPDEVPSSFWYEHFFGTIDLMTDRPEAGRDLYVQYKGPMRRQAYICPQCGTIFLGPGWI